MNNVREYLQPGDEVRSDIVAHIGTKTTVLVNSGVTVTEHMLANLEKFDCDFKKIRVVINRAGQTISNETPQQPKESGNKSEVAFPERLKNDAVTAAKQLFSEEVTPQEIHETSVLLSEDITDNILLAGPSASLCIQDLRVTDEYTYQHSVDVGVLGAQLAKKLGWSKEDIAITAQAGVLHDIGKRRVPLEILNKPGKLTDEEFTVMKLHPVYAYKDLIAIKGMDERVKLGAFEHHEKYSGGGYPRNLSGDNISKIAQILAIADVYDALTSKRPYKNGMSSARAVGIMAEMMNSFNKAYFTAFLQCITLYPLNSKVICTDGCSYKVIKHNPGHPTQPVLLNEFTNRRVDLLETREISIFGEDCEEIRNKLSTRI